MGQVVEELIEGAVDVESSAQGDQILRLDLSLSKVGRNVDFLEKILSGINRDDKILRSIVALGVTILLIRHTLEHVEHETRDRVELVELLLDVWCSDTNLGHAVAFSALDHLVASIDNSTSVRFGQIGNLSVAMLFHVLSGGGPVGAVELVNWVLLVIFTKRGR